MNSTAKSLVFWSILFVVGLLVWNFSSRLQRNENPVAFSEFVSWVDAGQVQRVVIVGNDITGVTKGLENFRTYAPFQYEGLANRLIERGVSVESKAPTESPWAAILYSWAPILLMIGFWIFFMRQVQSGGNKALSFGKSKAKLSSSASEEGDVPRCRRRRRSQGRAAGDHRVPEGTAEVPEARRPHSQRRPAHGPSGHRQDAAGPGRGR